MNEYFDINDIDKLANSDDLRDIFDFIDNNQEEIKEIEEYNEICPTCNRDDNIIEDTQQGFKVCKNCGQVISKLLDNNPEWKQYDDDKNSSRCSMPINKLLPQSSLGTTISGGAFKSRLKILHSWSAMPYKERSLNLVLKKIQDKCRKGNIMKCIEDDAKIMYKVISECRHTSGKNKGKYIIIRGANRRSLIAACVFFACKKKNMTRSPKEISKLFNLKYTEMTKGCKNFTKLMKLKQNQVEIDVGKSKPEHFITRFCNELKIKNELINEALKITNNINRLNIASDHTPFSIATSAILLVADNNGLSHITKKIISEKFGVSEVTISKTYKKLWQYRHIISSNSITEQILMENKNIKNSQKIPNHVYERMVKFGIKIDDKDKIPTKYYILDDIKNIELEYEKQNKITRKLNERYNNICQKYY